MLRTEGNITEREAHAINQTNCCQLLRRHWGCYLPRPSLILHMSILFMCRDKNPILRPTIFSFVKKSGPVVCVLLYVSGKGRPLMPVPKGDGTYYDFQNMPDEYKKLNYRMQKKWRLMKRLMYGPKEEKERYQEQLRRYERNRCRTRYSKSQKFAETKIMQALKAQIADTWSTAKEKPKYCSKITQAFLNKYGKI